MNKFNELVDKCIVDDIQFFEQEFETPSTELLQDYENFLKLKAEATKRFNRSGVLKFPKYEFKSRILLDAYGDNIRELILLADEGAVSEDDDVAKENQPPKIKQEKLSGPLDSLKKNTDTPSIDGDNIKREKRSIMLPPANIPPRKAATKKQSTLTITPHHRATRVTRSRMKKEMPDVEDEVIMQEPQIDVVNVSDNSLRRSTVANLAPEENPTVNATYVKPNTSVSSKKRSVSDSPGSPQNTHAQKRRRGTTHDQEMYDEPPRLSPMNVLCATYCLPRMETTSPTTHETAQQPTASIVKSRLTVEKASHKAATRMLNGGSPLISEDESESEETTPISEEAQNGSSKLRQKSLKSDVLFSSYQPSPVRKKVEAFEKLTRIPIKQEHGNTKAETPQIPITRAKTQALVNQIHEKQNQASAKKLKPFLNSKSSLTLANANVSSLVKEKAKVFTPVAPAKQLRSRLGSGKTAPQSHSTPHDSSFLSKTVERSGIRKRELMLKAESEKRKRIRDEDRQAKLREQEEQRQQNLLKLQRLKEERHRKAMQEKEAKEQRLREEREKKGLLAKQRALLEKQKKDASANEVMKTVPVSRKHPRYMVERMPVLPVLNDFDSDDSDDSLNCRSDDSREINKQKTNMNIKPAWMSKENLRFMLMSISVVGNTIKESFFSMQPQSPDLSEIFEQVDPSMLKRTSSAVWRKPPRYTLMREFLPSQDV